MDAFYKEIDLNKVVYIETYSICKTWIITLYFYFKYFNHALAS